MTHEQAAAEMVIDNIRKQTKFIQAAGMSQANLEILVDAINGSLDVYDASRKKMKESDERLREKMVELAQ